MQTKFEKIRNLKDLCFQMYFVNYQQSVQSNIDVAFINCKQLCALLLFVWKHNFNESQQFRFALSDWFCSFWEKLLIQRILNNMQNENSLFSVDIKFEMKSMIVEEIQIFVKQETLKRWKVQETPNIHWLFYNKKKIYKKILSHRFKSAHHKFIHPEKPAIPPLLSLITPKMW